MPASDLEVFDYFSSDAETPGEVDFLAYAIFAFRKKHWVAHFKELNSRPPNQGEIDGWISQQSDFEFQRMRNEAVEFFDEAAKTYLAEYVEAEKKQAVDHSILEAVKHHTSAWRHAGIALLMAVVAPAILGGVLFLASIFDSQFHFNVTASSATTSPAAPQGKKD
jgi:phosphoglycolate phosphatase-like HAD superfamily hydrolase